MYTSSKRGYTTAWGLCAIYSPKLIFKLRHLLSDRKIPCISLHFSLVSNAVQSAVSVFDGSDSVALAEHTLNHRLLQYQATLTSAGNSSNDCTRICIIQTAIACFFTDLAELRLAMTRSYGNDSQCRKMGHGRRDILLVSYVWNEGLPFIFTQIWVWLVAVPFCEQCWRHWMNTPSKLLRL